jgi:hypothetical protein
MKQPRKPQTSKLAQRERHKLLAAFYNNVAVAWIVAGVIVPYIAFFHNDMSILGFLNGEMPIRSPEGRLMIGYAFGISAAVCFAILFRWFASRELENLK